MHAHTHTMTIDGGDVMLSYKTNYMFMTPGVSVYPSVCVSDCMSVYPSVYQFVVISVG